jgi:hypothetical protein
MAFYPFGIKRNRRTYPPIEALTVVFCCCVLVGQRLKRMIVPGRPIRRNTRNHAAAFSLIFLVLGNGFLLKAQLPSFDSIYCTAISLGEYTEFSLKGFADDPADPVVLVQYVKQGTITTLGYAREPGGGSWRASSLQPLRRDERIEIEARLWTKSGRRVRSGRGTLSVSPAHHLLEKTSPALAAWSLRKLTPSPSSVHAIEVLRAQDGQQTSIGFTGNTLDTNALLEFSSGSALYVRTWYDQSGNQNHAYQHDTLHMPRIVDSKGTIFRGVGGRPSIRFANENDFLISGPFSQNSTYSSFLCVTRPAYQFGWIFSTLSAPGTNSSAVSINQSSCIAFQSGGLTLTSPQKTRYDEQYIVCSVDKVHGGSLQIFRDHDTISDTGSASTSAVATHLLHIGTIETYTHPSRFFDGTISELVLLSGPLSSAGAVTGDVNGYYQLVKTRPAQADPVAVLPQNEYYQVVLREYLKTLDSTDFVVPPLGLDPSRLPGTSDSLHALWLFLKSSRRPEVEGLRTDPSFFTLESIERPAGIAMTTDLSGFIDPVATAFWADWNVPVNPYYGNRGVMLRAFVSSVIEMIMLDNTYSQKAPGRSDYLGASLEWLGYSYFVARDILPWDVRIAYEEGLRKMVDYIEPILPFGAGGGTMEMGQIAGLYYIAHAINDDDFTGRCFERCRHAASYQFRNGYYHAHGGTYDASYTGITLDILGWGAMLWERPELTQYLDSAVLLKSMLTFPDPDGSVCGPSSFSTATADGPPNDQWRSFGRDNALAMLTPRARYLTTRIALPSPESAQQFQSQIRAELEKYKAGTSFTKASDKTPGLWHKYRNGTYLYRYSSRGVAHWTRYYRKGFLDTLVQCKNRNDQSLLPFHLRDGATRHLFVSPSGKLLFSVAKSDSFSAVIHTGEVSTAWGKGIGGLGGGDVCAFWTRQGGTFVLGRSRGSQGSSPDLWNEDGTTGVRRWGVHHLWGYARGGAPFSSAKIRFPSVRVQQPQSGISIVTVSADLAKTEGNHSHALSGPCLFTRTMLTHDAGISVRTSIEGNAGDSIQSLTESVPLFHRLTRYQDSDISLYADCRVGGAWVPLDSMPRKCDRIRLRRFQDTVYCLVDTPIHAATGDINQTTYQFSKARVQPLQLQLPQASPASEKYSATITWHLLTSPRAISFDSLLEAGLTRADIRHKHGSASAVVRTSRGILLRFGESAPEGLMLRLYSVIGRKVREIGLSPDSRTAHVDFSRDEFRSLPAGRYILSVRGAAYSFLLPVLIMQ